MYQEYYIRYVAQNHYDQLVNDAYWQFLILPEENPSQQLVYWEFSNSLHTPYQTSTNGFGFKTLKVHPRKKFQDISFEAAFTLLKKHVNPFDFSQSRHPEADYAQMDDLNFRVDFEPFLRQTPYTQLPEKHRKMFLFDKKKTPLENVQSLNHWVFGQLSFTAGVTDVSTTLEEIIGKGQGVCQDFTHLFCAVAKENKVPARYVSGYLDQGGGYFGDSHMHAWSEVYLPNIGWIGFDPTNNILAATSHIKVCHGKDYRDCAPLKGVVYAPGDHTTTYAVQVSSQQQ